jgi:hypothetical protein
VGLAVLDILDNLEVQVVDSLLAPEDDRQRVQGALTKQNKNFEASDNI